MKKKLNPLEVVKNFNKSNKFDPNGSYTGATVNDDYPVQDADDL
ncbi:MAG: hypothetical protein RR454_03010 [Clostridia bacterium]